MAPLVLRPLAFGEIIDQAFGLYRRCFVPLVLISLICSGLPALLGIFNNASGGSATMMAGGNWGLALVTLLLSFFGGALANCASTFVVSEQYLGRNLEAREALERAWPRLGAILATTMTVGLLTGIGFILLIIPGIIAAAGFSLAVTACTIEGLDSGAARNRSWELTKGFKGHMLGLTMVYGIIIWIVLVGVGVLGSTVLGGIMAAAEGADTFPLILVGAVSALLTLLLNPILYCILIVAYYDLRVRKEAFDLDLLATTLEHTAVPR